MTSTIGFLPAYPEPLRKSLSLLTIDPYEPPRRNYPRFWVEDEDEAPVSKEELNRLCKQFCEYPKKLNVDEQDKLCRSLPVDEIFRLALKALPEKTKSPAWEDPIEEPPNDEEPLTDASEVQRIANLLFHSPHKLKEAELRKIYRIMYYPDVVDMALNQKDFSSEDELLELYDLCRVLPYKLFAHVFYFKTGVRLFGSHEETSSNIEEPKALGVASTSLTIEDALDHCTLCLKDGHTHYRCPYGSSVPLGATIGPDFTISCPHAGVRAPDPSCCPFCREEGGYARFKVCHVCHGTGDCKSNDDMHKEFRERFGASTF